jgi:hypothetical protein
VIPLHPEISSAICHFLSSLRASSNGAYQRRTTTKIDFSNGAVSLYRKRRRTSAKWLNVACRDLQSIGSSNTRLWIEPQRLGDKSHDAKVVLDPTTMPLDSPREFPVRGKVSSPRESWIFMAITGVPPITHNTTPKLRSASLSESL